MQRNVLSLTGWMTSDRLSGSSSHHQCRCCTLESLNSQRWIIPALSLLILDHGTAVSVTLQYIKPRQLKRRSLSGQQTQADGSAARQMPPTSRTSNCSTGRLHRGEPLSWPEGSMPGAKTKLATVPRVVCYRGTTFPQNSPLNPDVWD